MSPLFDDILIFLCNMGLRKNTAWSYHVGSSSLDDGLDGHAYPGEPHQAEAQAFACVLELYEDGLVVGESWPWSCGTALWTGVKNKEGWRNSATYFSFLESHENKSWS